MLNNLLNLLVYLIIGFYCITFGLYQPCFSFLNKLSQGKKSGDTIYLSNIKNVNEIKLELFAFNWISKFAPCGTSCSIIFFVIGGLNHSNIITGVWGWTIGTMFIINTILKELKLKKLCKLS